MDILMDRKNGIFDVVNHSEVMVGDEFVYGLDKNNRPIKRKITNIIEQRKERGQYADESNRRMWAKIKQEIIPFEV